MSLLPCALPSLRLCRSGCETAGTSSLHLSVQSWLTRAEGNPTCNIQQLFREHLSAHHVVLTHTHPPTTAVSSPRGPHKELQLHTNNIPTNYEQTSSETSGPSESPLKPQHPSSSALVGLSPGSLYKGCEHPVGPHHPLPTPFAHTSPFLPPSPAPYSHARLPGWPCWYQ